MNLFLVTVAVFIGLQAFLGQQRSYVKPTHLVPPSNSIKHFTFGYDHFLSALMWVRVVQDFHVCDQQKERAVFPGPNPNLDPITDALTRELPDSTCEMGWVYKMLDVITELSPNFKRVYYDGATMLSVIVDDREGAKKIYDKGIEMYPDDWNILYRAAYHELFEMQDGAKAGELLFRAADRGAPGWVYSLAAKLHTRFGKAALAKGILESVLAGDRAGPFRDRLERQLGIINQTLESGDTEPQDQPQSDE